MQRIVGRCETINTKKTIVYKSDTRYVDIELNSTYTLRVNFECGTNDGFISKHFQTKTKQSSLLELFLRSETFCDSKVCIKCLLLLLSPFL